MATPIDETDETDEEIAAPVLGPLVAAARSLGLDVDRPAVLGAGANVTVHLAPSPVVARVATLTAEMRRHPERYLLREREVSAALLALGVHVIGHTDLVDPGPHRLGDTAFVLLDHRTLDPIDPDRAHHAAAVGRAYAELSTALAGLGPQLGSGDDGQPWDEMATLVRTVAPTTDPAALTRIEREIEALRATEPDDRWQLVHGDAHRVNVAFCGGRVTWFDFEDTNRRPLAWDLATLRRSWPAAGDEACRLLDVDPAGPSMRWHHELREVYALLWNLLYAQRHRRARAATADRLRRWLAQR